VGGGGGLRAGEGGREGKCTCSSRYNEGCAGLINENGVHLIHHRKVEVPHHQAGFHLGQVVSQVVCMRMAIQRTLISNRIEKPPEFDLENRGVKKLANSVAIRVWIGRGRAGQEEHTRLVTVNPAN